MTGTWRVGLLALLVATGLVRLAAAQEPEVIVIDPNHPIIQRPGTVSPATGPTPAAAPELVPLPAAGVNAREVLAGLWFRYRALVEQGDREQAARQLATAQAFMRREGLRSSPEIAAALLAEAQRRLEEGDYRRAKESFVLAARFAPELPAPHLGLASALLRGDRDPAGAVSEWWGGVRAALGDPELLYNLAGNGLLAAALALGMGAIGLLLLLVLKNAPAFFHDLHERAAGWLSEDGARLLGWGLLALPALALVPVVWVLAAWGALIFTYLRRGERIVAAAALLVLASAGPVTRLLAWHLGTAADPGARALIQSARQGPSLRHERTLKQLAQDHPREVIFPFLLASAYRTAGRLDEAVEEYRRVLEIDPADARAMVNMGNVHALRQEFAVSQTLYKKAAEADPRMALAHYDSHLAHLEAFHLEAADAELREARRLDAALVTGLLAEAAGGQGRRTPQDAVYSAREIWTRALRLRLEGGLRGEAARALTAPSTLAGIAGLLAALLLPGIGLAPRSGAARRCRRCGRPFCRRCQVTTKHPDVCSQCAHLFILRDGLAPGVKSRKLEEVASYRRRVFVGTRLLSLLLPGSGHVLGGRVVLGGALLVAWAGAWIGLLLRGRLMVTPEAIAPAIAPETTVPLVALAFAAWLLGNMSSHEAFAD